jgi:hypothetical protein
LQKHVKVSKALKEKTGFFQVTPIANTHVSVALRRANVQNVIMRSICKIVWQPLFCAGLWKDQSARIFVSKINSALLEFGFRHESSWRKMTLEAAEKCANDPGFHEEVVKNVMDDILEKLNSLIVESTLNSLREDLEKVLTEAVLFWSAVQKDGSRIEATIEPDQNDVDGWTDGMANLTIVDVDELTLLSPSKTKKCYSLLLFPRIVRSSSSAAISGQTGKYADTEAAAVLPVVLYKGCALFEHSDIFHYGAKELEDRERLIEVTLGNSTNTWSPTATIAPKLPNPEMKAQQAVVKVLGPDQSLKATRTEGSLKIDTKQ